MSFTTTLSVTSESEVESQKKEEDPLSQIWNAIWTRRPILGEILQKHGSDILYDYTKGFFDVNPNPYLEPRKEEFYTVVHSMLQKRLGWAVADGVVRQLHKLPLVSTADHHGSIDCPLWVNSNIISGIPYFEHEDPDFQYLVTFSFASVSLNNADAYPRGLVFHGGMGGEGVELKLPLFLDKEKMSVVYGTRPYNMQDLERASQDLQKKVKEGKLGPKKARGVQGLLDRFFAAEDVLAAPDLCTQISILNYRLWPEIFHPVRDCIPDLVYLEIESLVTELFLEHHINREDSLLHRFVFDSAWSPLVLKYFDSIPGAFSLEGNWGSFLFWGLDERNQRVRLLLKGNALESEDASIHVELSQESIKAALIAKKIFPGMFLAYLTIALYYGMKCLGGFCQVSDLTRTKQAWQGMLTELGLNEEAAALDSIQSKELGGDGMVLAYFKSPDGNLVPPTGIDMILAPQVTSFEDYVEHAKELTFSQIMNPMAPVMYRVLYSSQDRNPAYTRIEADTILDSTGLKAKLLDWSCMN